MLFRKTGNHVTRTIACETIVVPIRGSVAELESIFVLNEVGAAIWKQLDAVRGEDEIAAALSDEFEVAPETARADVTAFLDALLDARLIERDAQP